jgi:threonine/homoserine/homoserine lactone efflux protein
MLDEIIKILFGGFCVGLASSVTVGPVAVLCIQRTLNKGRAKGFMTGLGITFSDTLYVLCTSFGLSLVMDFLQEKQTFLIVKLVGCALLLIFGIYTIRNNPLAKQKQTKQKDDSLLSYTGSGFLVAIANPLVVFIYIGMFAYFSFPISEFEGVKKFVAFASVIGGDICWWLFLSFLINKLRNRFDLRGIWMINRILGCVLIVASIVWFVYTVVTI